MNSESAVAREKGGIMYGGAGATTTDKKCTQDKCYTCGARLKGKIIEIELPAMAWQTEPVLLKVWADVCPNGCKS